MSQDSSDQRPPQSESLQTISSDNTTTTTKHTEKRISETKLENGNHCLSDIARGHNPSSIKGNGSTKNLVASGIKVNTNSASGIAPPTKILTNSSKEVTSPVLQNSNTPILGSANTSGTNIPVRNQSVSFSDIDNQERSRRFTISAKPSTVNVPQEVQLPQSSRHPSSAAPSRQSSVKTKRVTSPVNSGEGNVYNDVLTFMTNHSHGKLNTALPSNVHVGAIRSDNSSPITPEGAIDPGFNFDYNKNSLNRIASPSPPPFSRSNGSSSTSSPKRSKTPNTQEPVPPQEPITTTEKLISEPSSQSAIKPLPSSQIVQPIKITGTGSANSSRRGSLKKSNKTIVSSPIGPPVPFQQFLSKQDDGKFHILLACTGSVATIKVPLIIDKLFQIFTTSKISIQLVLTKSSSHFLRGCKIHEDVKIWRDEDEWANFSDAYNSASTTVCSTMGNDGLNVVNKKPKNPFEKLILHNELRKWADIMLIAPLSANTLAKIANGIADNLLTSIVRSWCPSTFQQVKKPIIVAPAMNTFMYTHPITAKQLNIILSPDFGIEVLKPVEKILVCGDIGMGGD